MSPSMDAAPALQGEICVQSPTSIGLTSQFPSVSFAPDQREKSSKPKKGVYFCFPSAKWNGSQDDWKRLTEVMVRGNAR